MPTLLANLMIVALLPVGQAWATEIRKPARSGTILLGDSMMRIGVGPVLKKTVAKAFGTRVDMRAKSATGLTRNDFYDWPKELQTTLGEQGYERAIVMIGANDCQNIKDGDKTYSFGTDAWREAYRRRVRNFLDVMCGDIDQVVWIGLPPMRSAKFDARIKELNGLIEAEVKESECGRFVPADLATATGGFTSMRKIKKRRLKIREDDGVHITQNGGTLIAEDVLDALGK